MGSTQHQEEVCSFVREIIAARTSEPVSISSRPDVEHRNDQAVEELWDAPSLGYAVEHTKSSPSNGSWRTSGGSNDSCRP